MEKNILQRLKKKKPDYSLIKALKKTISESKQCIGTLQYTLMYLSNSCVILKVSGFDKCWISGVVKL